MIELHIAPYITQGNATSEPMLMNPRYILGVKLPDSERLRFQPSCNAVVHDSHARQLAVTETYGEIKAMLEKE